MITIKAAPLDDVWSMRQLVMYPDETIEFVKLEDDETGAHWGLYLDEALVSVISVFERGQDVQFRKFATVPGLQGQGYGSILLQHVFDRAMQEGKLHIWCNARLSATGIYRKFGMEPTGDGWSRYGIDFIKMQKKLK